VELPSGVDNAQEGEQEAEKPAKKPRKQTKGVIFFKIIWKYMT